MWPSRLYLKAGEGSTRQPTALTKTGACLISCWISRTKPKALHSEELITVDWINKYIFLAVISREEVRQVLVRQCCRNACGNPVGGDSGPSLSCMACFGTEPEEQGSPRVGLLTASTYRTTTQVVVQPKIKRREADKQRTEHKHELQSSRDSGWNPDCGIKEYMNSLKKFIHFFSYFLFFKLWKHDNTFIGNLEITEQNYI